MRNVLICRAITCIKTHGRVSVAKKDVRCTSVLFTGATKSPFSTLHISITTGPISINFTYFIYMPFIYMTLHSYIPNLKIGLVAIFKIYVSENFSISSYFLFLHKKNLSQEKTMYLWINFLQIWYTNKAHCSLQ